MNKEPKILLADSEQKLCLVIKEELCNNGYYVTTAFSGLGAIKIFDKQRFDLVILDCNLLINNGIEVCKYIRLKNKKVPIIMLSASGEINDKMEVFTIGADDYIIKPFHFVELMARIKVFLKTKEPIQNNELTVSGVYVDMLKKNLLRDGIPIFLTKREFELLTLLMKNNDRVVSKIEILDRIFDIKGCETSNIVEVYISFLRRKIDKPFNNKLIHTKPGFGYYFKSQINTNDTKKLH